MFSWWGGSKTEPTAEAQKPAGATESKLVDLDMQLDSSSESGGGMFSGITGFFKSATGWDSIEVSKVDQTLSETEGRAKATQEQRQKIWQQAVRFVGMDPISMMSLPIWAFEPTTFLQRMAEPFRYAEFLDKAAATEDPIMRLAHLAAFNVSILSLTERSGKPFNPILGETYEFVSKGPKPFKFLSEQVSHHPPIGVAQTNSDNWICKQEAHIKTTFYGNSIDIFAVGHTHVHIPGNGDHFYWKQPDCRVYNIIVGGMWVDYTGDVEIINENGKEKCVLSFKKCGWFGEGRYEVTGEVLDAEGRVRLLLIGKWNEFLCAKKVDENGKKAADEFYLWERGEKEITDNKWGMPKFSFELTAVPPELERVLPETDSRLRTDRRALENGDSDLAGREKTRLEEKQRADRRALEERSEKWQPKYFKRVPNDKTDHTWEYVGNYWEEREKRAK